MKGYFWGASCIFYNTNQWNHKVLSILLKMNCILKLSATKKESATFILKKLDTIYYILKKYFIPNTWNSFNQHFGKTNEVYVLKMNFEMVKIENFDIYIKNIIEEALIGIL